MSQIGRSKITFLIRFNWIVWYFLIWNRNDTLSHDPTIPASPSEEARTLVRTNLPLRYCFSLVNCQTITFCQASKRELASFLVIFYAKFDEKSNFLYIFQILFFIFDFLPIVLITFLPGRKGVLVVYLAYFLVEF